MHMHTIAPLVEDRDPATQLAKEKQMSTEEQVCVYKHKYINDMPQLSKGSF